MYEIFCVDTAQAVQRVLKVEQAPLLSHMGRKAVLDQLKPHQCHRASSSTGSSVWSRTPYLRSTSAHYHLFCRDKATDEWRQNYVSNDFNTRTLPGSVAAPHSTRDSSTCSDQLRHT